MVTALMVRPDSHPTITQLVDDGNYLSCAVSVDVDVPFTADTLEIETEIVAIHSYEGTILGIAPNRQVGSKVIAGVFYIAGVHKGKLRSLTDEEIVSFTLQFWETEIHTEDEVFDSWFS